MSLLESHQESLEGAMAGADEIMHRQRRRPKRLEGKSETTTTTAPPPAQAKAGWDDADSTTDNTIPTMEAHEKEHYSKLVAEEDDIPIIPSLQQESEEVFQRQVADAPDAISTEVQGLKELDDQYMYLPSSKLDIPVDLSVLTSILSAPGQIVEEDLAWNESTFRELLHEVAASSSNKLD